MAEPKNYRRHVYATVLTALFAAIIAVCSFVTVPGPVPFTLQTFGVFCALTMLGGRLGLLATLLYLALGAAGLPVFAGFTGGLGHLAGPTGGYLLGFVFTALVYWLTVRLAGDGLRAKVLGCLIGLVVCYAFGTAWFVLVHGAAGGAVSFSTALGACVAPFVLPDLIKTAGAVLLSAKLAPVIQKKLRR